MTFSWARAASGLRRLVAEDAARATHNQHLDEGQRASLMWIAKRIQQSGVVLADEVGTGKTRIACAVVRAVLKAGGRAAVVVPHGLMHQWQKEAETLGLARAKEFTSLGAFVGEAKVKEWNNIAPSPDESEWILVSHGFRSPQVRIGKNPAEWRVALASYVRAELSAANRRSDGRTKFGKLLSDPHEVVHEIAKAISARVAVSDRNALRKSLDDLPTFKRGGSNEKLIWVLQEDSGRNLIEELLGLWLGRFDLVVIDEAHKSRDDDDTEDGSQRLREANKVLPRLLEYILQTANNYRRLCLTATPMELDLSQWLDLLLVRARSGLDRERGREVVEQLHKAAGRAAVAPDEVNRLDELCAAARNFTRALSPYVTRRRRNDDRLITSFRTAANHVDNKLLDGLSHPHRRLKQVQIGWAQTVGKNSAWLDVLFAAECMSQSARGLSLADTKGWPRAVRDAYTKLSAGHVSDDLSETSDLLCVPEPGMVDDRTRGKIARVAYWYRRLHAGRQKVPDAEHPRILAAVKEIEKWTAQREKVLVFGVFLQPLHLLRDVLNVRHALRAADVGSPISHAVHSDSALLGIAVRQFDRLRDEGVLKDRLATGKCTKMRRALQDSHKAYKKLRRQVREGAKKYIKAWYADPALLGGAPVDRKLETALQNHLVSFVLDDFLAKPLESEQPTRERLDELAPDFFEDYLRPLLGELGDEDAGDEEQAKLRQDALRKALLEDYDGYDGRQSLHARLLQGATRWETRRYLQTAFNRPDASPWVLVAQSQVGREGLNLHEDCRVVVQFHAEWNPAVLEQQIGRVDRKGSRWEQLAQAWLQGGMQGPPPFVEVRQLVFEGTYDAFQWERVMRRQHVFDASLFGSLLPNEAWQRLSSDDRQKLIEAAPSFKPFNTVPLSF
ncbi:MAG: SNF2-related protein [bacterium]